VADYLSELRRAAGQSAAGAAANQMKALHRAVSAAREQRERGQAEREQESFEAIERVREIADRLRVSEQRVTDLEGACKPRGIGLRENSERQRSAQSRRKRG
jgi:hypothetical protein